MILTVRLFSGVTKPPGIMVKIVFSVSVSVSLYVSMQ